jgi:hypothetical protein
LSEHKNKDTQFNPASSLDDCSSTANHTQNRIEVQETGTQETAVNTTAQVLEGANHLTELKQKIVQPLHSPLLELPSPSNPAISEVITQDTTLVSKEDKRKTVTRRSPRIQSKIKKKPAIKLAQEVLAKKWGILDVEKEIEELTLQQYMDIYKRLLSQPAILAVKKLTEVAEMKKKIKKDAAKKKKYLANSSSTLAGEEAATA